MAINSRAKGKRGEAEIAALLRARGIPARRGVQFSGGPGSPDVAHALDAILHFEVKLQQKLQIEDWYDQAVVDARYRLAVVLHRKTAVGKPVRWLATTSLREFATLLRLPESEDWSTGAPNNVRRRLANTQVAPTIIESNALRFDHYFESALTRAGLGQVPALVHTRRDHDSIWMVSVQADDLLEAAIQYAMESYGWQPTFGSDGFADDLERHYRAFWNEQRPKLARLMPLFSGGE